MEGKIKIGPVGKDSRSYVNNWDEGSHNNIVSQIFLSHDSDGICSIQFQFVIDDNKFILSDLHGRKCTGNKFDVIALEWPHEYISGISGEYCMFSGNIGIKSLKFATNSNEYGPFGSRPSKDETKFNFKLGKLSQFGGFFGTSDGHGLQSIGVYLQPSIAIPKTNPKTGTRNAEETKTQLLL